MWKDPIVEEVRKVREAYAADHAFDLAAMGEDLKREENKSERKVVSLPPRPAQEQEPSAA